LGLREGGWLLGGGGVVSKVVWEEPGGPKKCSMSVGGKVGGLVVWDGERGHVEIVLVRGGFDGGPGRGGGGRIVGRYNF